MRRGESLTRAAKAAGTTRKNVLKNAGRRIERTKEGKYIARRSDYTPRVIRFLSRGGVISINVRGSESRARIGEYWNAVSYFLKTGDTTKLRAFRGKYLQAQGKRYPFITDPPLLERLAHAGEVQFEDIYNVSV
ncbi:MAG: hypothetical protein M3R65_05370 [Gemmatimonadota bacterium]|nr:hypothetical protein [Gemmatimonadota bacterium]